MRPPNPYIRKTVLLCPILLNPHCQRGISYLKIGLRWLRGVLHKGRDLLKPVALISTDPQPCFASKKAKRQYYDAIWFSRIDEIKGSIV